MSESEVQPTPDVDSMLLRTVSQVSTGNSAGLSTFWIIAKAGKARSGFLRIPKKGGVCVVQTPMWVATTSRGVVPHLTPDNFTKYGCVDSIYVALEDFIEKGPRGTPPIYTSPIPDTQSASTSSADSAVFPPSRLLSFIGLEQDRDHTITILSPRRPIPVVPSVSNTVDSISVCTSVGFRNLSKREYTDAISLLRPTMAVLMADVLYRHPESRSGTSRKRMEKMGIRSAQWVREAVEGFRGGAATVQPPGVLATSTDATASELSTLPLLFAPVLPIPIDYQLPYLDSLGSDDTENGLRSHITGIVLPGPPTPFPTGKAVEEGKNEQMEELLDDTGAVSDKVEGWGWRNLPAKLDSLARLSVAEYKSPHDILDHMETEIVDIFCLSFVNQFTDSGVALSFEFKPSDSVTTVPDVQEGEKGDVSDLLPLGIDLWDHSYATSTEKLVPNCDCYSCRTHHRAYVNHLLNAKEMLAWTLLQIHNHAVVTRFFADIRESIAAGANDGDDDDGSATTTQSTFVNLVKGFRARYEREIPAGSGPGPRVRGYQFKSEGPGEPKKNPPAYQSFDGKDA